MPVRQKGEAHRALELLEDYHSRLNRVEDRQLRQAIERVITIFKSRLFQALLDIQEFYEATLLNEAKPLHQKISETNNIATKWEQNPPIISSGTNQQYDLIEKQSNNSNGLIADRTDSTPNINSNYRGYEEPRTPSRVSQSSTPLANHNVNYPYPAPSSNSHAASFSGGSAPRPRQGPPPEPSTRPNYFEAAPLAPSEKADSDRIHSTGIDSDLLNTPSDIWPDNQDQLSVNTMNGGGGMRGPMPGVGGSVAQMNGNGLHKEWEYEEIRLEKGRTGLGFSIAGGSDNPHIEDDPGIYVTKIIEGGAAMADGRLKRDDVILRVNGVDTDNVPHNVAVDALKNAGGSVRLYVRRARAFSSFPGDSGNKVETVHLTKTSKGLGFSIAGGVGNEHLPGDTGIYVTKLIEGGAAQHEGKLQVGDRILAVDHRNLEGVTHEDAVNALKATSERVNLRVIRAPYPGGVSPPGVAQFGDSSFDHHLNHSATHQPPFSRLDQNAIHNSSGNVGYPPPTYSAGRDGDGRQQYNEPPSSSNVMPTPSYNSNAHNVPINGGAPMPSQLPSVNSQWNDVAPIGTSSPKYSSPSGDIPRSPRRLQLTKGAAGLGFNIVGGEDGEGIYISHIAPGGVADVSGLLHKGDQLLEVNDADLRAATHEQAAAALKNSGSYVTVVAQYKPEEYQRFESKIEQLRNDMIHQGVTPSLKKREMFVRALFDYDPTRDSGLPAKGLAFSYGDILHVTNASDEEWWNARRVLKDGAEEGYGIIPGKQRIEKKERARRKQVNFTADGHGTLGSRSGSMSEKHKKSYSFSRRFPFMKSKERLNDDSDAERPDDLVLSYQMVEQQSLPYSRPVIVLGPLKDRVNDELISKFPDRFGSCVPHTSRSMRDNEVDGRDYHFVPNREQMERDIQNHMFIEAGQYNGNLYGTSIASVRTVAQQGKHCILDVSGNAIRRLQAAGLYPVAVCIKPDSAAQLMEWNRRLSEEEAEKQFSRAQMIESEFAEYFTAIIQGNTPEEICARVNELIWEESRPSAWIPSKEPV